VKSFFCAVKIPRCFLNFNFNINVRSKIIYAIALKKTRNAFGIAWQLETMGRFCARWNLTENGLQYGRLSAANTEN